MAARSTEQLPFLTEKLCRLIANDHEEETMDMLHHVTRGKLPRNEIIEVWTRLVGGHGEPESFSDTFGTTPHGTKPDGEILGKSDDTRLGSAIGVTTINLEAGEVMGRVAFDEDDAVVGILALSTDTTGCPF